MNPASPGRQIHKLDRAKDKNSWSVRVSSDIRLILRGAEASLLRCYVDHHDAAYRWADRRRVERHPMTGAAQLVEVRETVQEFEIPRYVESEAPLVSAVPKAALFDGVPDDELLGYGVAAEWLDEVRRATEDTLFDLAEHLPGEVAEALLGPATGGAPQRALEYPWEKWTVFLHPAQRDIVEEGTAGRCASRARPGQGRRSSRAAPGGPSGADVSAGEGASVGSPPETWKSVCSPYWAWIMAIANPARKGLDFGILNVCTRPPKPRLGPRASGWSKTRSPGTSSSPCSS